MIEVENQLYYRILHSQFFSHHILFASGSPEENVPNLASPPPGRASADPADPEVETTEQRSEQVSRTYEGLVQLVGTYWVLFVVAAFLMVMLMGDPGLLKTVYVVFFFYFMITYQVIGSWEPSTVLLRCGR